VETEASSNSERASMEAAMTQATDEVLQLVPKANGSFVALTVGAELVEACRAGTLEGLAQIRLNINKRLAGLSFLTGTAFRCDEAEKSPFADRVAAARLGVQSIVSVPLRTGTRVIGTLVAVSRDRAAFTEHDVEIVSRIGELLQSQLAVRMGRIPR
jgi:GAF domain-containing protein